MDTNQIASLFPTCPRCQVEWDNFDPPTSHILYGYRKICQQCGMLFNGVEVDTLLRLVVDGKYIVFWLGDDNSCCVNTAISDANHLSGFRPDGEDVNFSFPLPYTITAERLQLLLVFS